MSYPINIVADFREIPSKIPDLLEELGADVKRKQLKSGDYIINNEIIVERKSKEDFVLSLIQGRLFSQCARMKKTDKRVILLVEGNPYHTAHDIDRKAIKGALLSVSLCWQIPIIFSGDPQDSAHTLVMAATQLDKENWYSFPRPKNTKNYKQKVLYFIQGLPSVGPVIARKMLEKFGSVENIILAGDKALLEIKGLGERKVRKIRSFLSVSFRDKI